METSKSMCCLCLISSSAPLIDLYSKSGDGLIYFDKLSSSLYHLANVLKELNCNGYLICNKCCWTIDNICNFNDTCLQNAKTYSNLEIESSDVEHTDTDASLVVKTEVLSDDSLNDNVEEILKNPEEVLVKREIEYSDLSDLCQEIENDDIKTEYLDRFEVVFLENQQRTEAAEESEKFFWNKKSTQFLLQEYTKRIDGFRDPTVIKKKLWEEIAKVMRQHGYNVNTYMVDKKMRNMRKTYRTVLENFKQKPNIKPRWEYFKIFESFNNSDKSTDDKPDNIFASQESIMDIEPPSTTSPVPEKFYWNSNSTMLLLIEYWRRIDRFRNPKIERKILWEEISDAFSQHGIYVSAENVDRKMRNLKKTYSVIIENKNMKKTRWQFFEIYEKIIKYDPEVDDFTLYTMDIPFILDPSLDLNPAVPASQSASKNVASMVSELLNNPELNDEHFYWQEDSTRLLLNVYKDHLDRIRNKKIERHIIWKEIAQTMQQHGYNVDSNMVDRKIRNMKIRYRGILNNPNFRRDVKKPRWEYFEMLDEICRSEDMFYTQDAKIQLCTSKNGRTFDWQVESTQLMLDEYRKRLDSFKNPLSEKKLLWKEISAAMKEHGYSIDYDLIDRKMRSMKTAYKTILDSMNNENFMQRPRPWAYFDIFEEFFKEDFSAIYDSSDVVDVEMQSTEDSQPSTSQDASQEDTELPLTTTEQAETKKFKAFVCTVCGAKFIAKRNLNIHKFTHSGAKPHMCEICGKSYRVLGKFKEHMRTHTGERPFVCDVCGNTFPNKVNLDRHMMIHTGERPFACNICDKRFKIRSDLHKHDRVHTGEKPYVCNICGKAYKVSSVLYVHKRTHYNDVIYKCDICNITFTRKQSLKEHNDRLHKLKTA